MEWLIAGFVCGAVSGFSFIISLSCIVMVMKSKNPALGNQMQNYSNMGIPGNAVPKS